MELLKSEWYRPIQTAADIDHLAAQLYGSPPTRTGILHPCAVWQTPEATHSELLTTLNINDHTPQSPVDLFALNLARARADAILTTGRILRCEPDVTHALGHSIEMRSALAHWRRQHLGKANAPISLVLTSGLDLDLDHPLIVSGDTEPLIFTSPAGRARLLPRAPRSLEIVSVEKPSIHRAIEFLQRKGLGTISIEAGPGTSRELYLRPRGAIRIDELLLSTVRAPQIPEIVRGPLFMNREEIRRTFSRSLPPSQIQTDDGLWIFERFLRN